RNTSTLQMSSQRSGWSERLHANPSRMEQELATKLEHDRIHYLTQVEIPITTADFYFATRTSAIDHIRGWPRPSQDKPDDQRRRAQNIATEERIQNPRTIL